MESLQRSTSLSTQPLSQRRDRKSDYARLRGWKRKSSDEDELQDTKLKRYRLTEKNLLRHQKNVRITRAREAPPSSGSGRTRATATTNSTTLDLLSGPILVKNGVVFEESYTVPPGDHKAVKAALAKPQPLPASTHRHWLNIRASKAQMALGELSLESKVIEAMLAHHEPPLMYERFRNDQWTEIDNELTVGISDAKPDVVESYLWSRYPKGTRDDFEDLAPTQYGYAMPTFAMESKGAGEAGQAVRQAAYDGAIMTHAALSAESQMGKSEKSLYSNTKAITVTLNPDEICVYANHAIKDQSSNKIAYHHHCVERIRYLASEENWNNAHSILRNAQLFALTLADARVRDIEVHFREKAQRMDEVKAKHGRLKTEARAKTASNEGPPSSKRVSTSKPSHGTADPMIKSTCHHPADTQTKANPESTTRKLDAVKGKAGIGKNLDSQRAEI